MSTNDWEIPQWTLTFLETVPKDRPVAVLLRHSVRNRLPPGEAGNAVPITEEGRRLAVRLGELMGHRIRRLHTSPVRRCVETAECLNDGAMTNHELVQDRLLGDPGVYVVDGKLAWSNWERLGHEGVMQHLATSSEVLPGMAYPDAAARRLVRHMFSTIGDEPGLHVFVTHDVLVMPTVARLLRKPLSKDKWPWYLEGAFFWRTEGGIRVEYRDVGGIGHGE